MHLVVELFFDQATEAAVRTVWRALAAGFPADLLPRVAAACHRAVRPINGRLESIGLVEYGPRREHFAFGFAGSGRGC